MNDERPLLFSDEAKIRVQMRRRGWTDEHLREAFLTVPLPAQGKKGPALRYIHPKNGKSVVVDEMTGAIFHVGGEGFLYE